MDKVYGAIHQKGAAWYTQMGRIFDGIHNSQRNYNWLITDIDCVPPRIWALSQAAGYCWLTGEELTRIVREDDSQWVWAVLSGFSPEIPLSQILRFPLPCAGGYEGFWKTPLSIQHPLAHIQIVPWDSSLTLFFSRQEELVRDFLRSIPLSQELSSYITQQCP